MQLIEIRCGEFLTLSTEGLIMRRVLSKSIGVVTTIAFLNGCGGSGDDVRVSNPVIPAETLPSLESTKTHITAALVNGEPRWPSGSSSKGGNGKVISNVECLATEDYHIHSHLTLIINEKVVAIPADIGLQGCAYELHTHDQSGVIHIETAVQKPFTLGQFFAVWGQPLELNNIAGVAVDTLNVLVQDGPRVAKYSGDPTALELKAHRNIFIIVGKVPTHLPNYEWSTGL